MAINDDITVAALARIEGRLDRQADDLGKFRTDMLAEFRDARAEFRDLRTALDRRFFWLLTTTLAGFTGVLGVIARTQRWL
jgi:hypothetical protein